MNQFFIFALSLMLMAMALMAFAMALEMIESSDWWQRKKLKKWWNEYDKNQWGE